MTLTVPPPFTISGTSVFQEPGASASSATSADPDSEPSAEVATRVADLDDVVPIVVATIGFGLLTPVPDGDTLLRVLAPVIAGLAVGAVGWLLFERAESGAERAVFLLEQVCEALREAHGVGLVHRDVKPGNIFAAKRGGTYDVAKLLDFGLVKTSLGHDSSIHLTQEGAIAGSPLFMAPEQATGDGEPDARSDLYSVGCVAFFLLTGRVPFEGDKPLKVMMAHANQPPPSRRINNGLDLPYGHHILGKVACGVKRLDEFDRCTVYLYQFASPRLLVELFQIRLVVSRQLAVGSIVHDAELVMPAENLSRPLALLNQRKEMPQTEDVPDFVDQGFQLLPIGLSKHLRINYEFVPAGIREETVVLALDGESIPVDATH